MTKPNFNEVITNKNELGVIIKSMAGYIAHKLENPTSYFLDSEIHYISQIYGKLVNAYFHTYSSWGDDISYDHYKLYEEIQKMIQDRTKKMWLEKIYKEKESEDINTK